LILGFSPTVGYSCEDCFAVCCRSEYKLPLFNNEYEIYVESRSIAPFLLKNSDKQVKNSHWLLRTDSCLFLTNSKQCSLHQKTKNIKPLVCQVYPLIFWKEIPEVLAYVFPCKGLTWVAPYEHRIKNQEEIYAKIINTFNFYFGDQIDEENHPYKNILFERVLYEQTRLAELENNNWNWLQLIDRLTPKFRQYELSEIQQMLFQTLNNPLIINSLNWVEYQRSAFHWLTFNPNLLVLNDFFSIILRLLAISWGTEMLRLTDIDYDIPHKNINIDIIQISEQITWGMIQIFTNDWWKDFFPLIETKFPILWKKNVNNLSKLKKKIFN